MQGAANRNASAIARIARMLRLLFVRLVDVRAARLEFSSARYFLYDPPPAGLGGAVGPVLPGFTCPLIYPSIALKALSAVFALFTVTSPALAASFSERPIEAARNDKAASTADLLVTPASFSGSGLTGC